MPSLFEVVFTTSLPSPPPITEGTEKVKSTFRLKVNDG